MQSLRWSRPIGHDHYRNVRQSDPQIQHSQLDNWAADLRHRLPTAERFSATDFMERSTGDRRGQSAMMPTNFTTLPHLSVSSAMNFPKSAGEPTSGVLPRSASRALILGSARPALISLLSLSTISAGVAFGAPMPSHAIAS